MLAAGLEAVGVDEVDGIAREDDVEVVALEDVEGIAVEFVVARDALCACAAPDNIAKAVPAISIVESFIELSLSVACHQENRAKIYLFRIDWNAFCLCGKRRNNDQRLPNKRSMSASFSST